MSYDIAVWESEGGVCAGTVFHPALMGTRSEIEWAEGIRRILNSKFNSVARTLRSAASNKSVEKRKYVEEVIRILEEKRTEVMAREEARIFIGEWKQFGGRVRRMIYQDKRYLLLKAKATA
jgi:hypothetical protein